MASGKSPCGRKPRYKSAAEMQVKIDEYFESCEGELLRGSAGEVITDKFGRPVYVGQKPPTVTGLALALGFTGRQALLNYQAKPVFMDTILRAKAKCEAYAEERLYDRDGANGAQFSLKCNFGWNDRQPAQGGSEVSIIDDV